MSGSVWNPVGWINTAFADFISYLQVGTGTIVRTVAAKLLGLRKSIDEYGAVADGITDCTAALVNVIAASNGRFHFEGPGTYVLGAVPDVFSYPFTAGDNVSLKIAGVTYDVSNAFCGALRYTTDSPVLTSIRHAKTGLILVQLQDGTPGTATYFYRGLAFSVDSHFAQAKPATLNGSTDLLFQRSQANPDSNGNRFNITFDELNDRLLHSYATTASGSPSFDSFLAVYGGTSPKLEFPGLLGSWKQGIEITTRAAGNFGLEMIPASATRVDFRSRVSTNISMSFADNAVGFHGTAPTTKQALAANAVDLATVIALANDIKAKLVAKGLCS